MQKLLNNSAIQSSKIKRRFNMMYNYVNHVNITTAHTTEHNREIMPDKNLATFSQTYTDEDTTSEMLRYIGYNASNRTVYNEISEMTQDCLKFIADLWHGDEHCVGAATVGSTEACIMAGYSMLFDWKRRHNLSGEAAEEKMKPNLVISAANQLCWQKFKILSNIELREVPLTKEYRLDVEKAEEYFDDGTIGVVGILGNTQAGKYDDIQKLNAVVEAHNKKWNRNIKIHVDGASGAFFAPFIQPHIKFGFELNNVVSINGSGHKFGLAPCSIGWLLFRNDGCVAQELQHEVDYLGGGLLKDFGINFSTSTMFIAAQYHLFTTMGRDGYAKTHKKTLNVANYLMNEINKIPCLKLISHEIDIPVICYEQCTGMGWSLEDLEKQLEKTGWHVATYKMPSMDYLNVHRIVVRSDFSMDRAKRFIADLRQCIFILSNAEELSSLHLKPVFIGSNAILVDIFPYQEQPKVIPYIKIPYFIPSKAATFFLDLRNFFSQIRRFHSMRTGA